jgi:LuxR family transcriptional regulator
MLRSALSELMEQATQAASAASLYQITVAFVLGLGFNSLLISGEAESVALETTPPSVAMWPEGAWETYLREGHDSRNYIHARLDASPHGASWTSADPVADGEHARFLSYLDAFGIRGGIVAPVVAAAGRKRIIVATTDRREAIDPGLAACVAAAGNLVAMAEARLKASAPQGVALHRLSHRQLEILRWVSLGKSNADIATIAGMSERVVRFHVSEILRKLDVVSRAQAASFLTRAAVSRDEKCK